MFYSSRIIIFHDVIIPFTVVQDKQKKIKILTIQFANRLSPKLVPAFRGAIIEKVNREHILFHNHKSDTQVLYQYPLIQYKSLYGNSAIVCIGDGTMEIHRLFSKSNLNIKLHDEKVILEIHQMEMLNYNLSLNPGGKYVFEMVNWLGLNQKNLGEFNNCASNEGRVELLENVLKANILSFAKGIDWTIHDIVSVSILEIRDQRVIRYKGLPLLAFDILFECNVNLPLHIGLGKSVSHGYGMIKKRIKSL